MHIFLCAKLHVGIGEFSSAPSTLKPCGLPIREMLSFLLFASSSAVRCLFLLELECKNLQWVTVMAITLFQKKIG